MNRWTPPDRCKECGRKKPTKRKVSAKAKATRARQSARKAAKIATRRLTTGEIKAAVRERAGGVCENCGTRWGFWGWSLDHWEGGSGRKRERQSVENCWALCGTGTTGCHGDRTRNFPSAEHWNFLFADHCRRFGYAVPTLHVVHAAVPRSA